MLACSFRSSAPGCCALVLLTGCAPIGMSMETAPAVRPVVVQVTNDSQEIVNVFFQADGGARMRIGTLAPKSTGTFVPRLVNPRPGHFYAHRLGQPGPVSILAGVVDQQMLRTGTVLITIGPIPELDHWRIESERRVSDAPTG